MLPGILIGLLVATIFFLWLRRDLLSTTVFHKAVFWTCLLLNILLLISVIALVASAAENSAPAKNAVVIEKLAVTCPTEFNIDDSAWAMNRIDRNEKKISDGLMVIEHIRVFSHMWKPGCVAKLYSYGSLGDSDGKRVFAITKSPNGIIVLLLTEKGWESGDDIETFITDCDAMGCNLTFALYRNKELVASRTLPIRQFSIFRFHEPVE